MQKLIYCPNYSSFLKPYINNTLDLLKDNATVYSASEDIEGRVIFDSKLEYLYSANDPRLYSSYLNELKDNNIFETGLILRLTHPEYLYFDLITRENFDKKIILTLFAFELFSTSPARRKVMELISKLECIEKIIIHSIEGVNCSLPNDFNDFAYDMSKFIFLDEPLYEDENLYSIKKNANNAKDKLIGLYFGNMFYGKGVDILLEAASHLPDNIELVIAGNMKSSNFDLKFDNYKNVKMIDKFFSEEEMITQFIDCDFVILPYRKTYIHGTSGVFVQANRAGKPIVVPEFPPFGSLVKKYKNGLSFEPENSKDLARAIIELCKNKNHFAQNTVKYTSQLTSWDNFIKEID
jgi:glycosyltransferase involved in cell wall biosynthesis